MSISSSLQDSSALQTLWRICFLFICLQQKIQCFSFIIWYIVLFLAWQRNLSINRSLSFSLFNCHFFPSFVRPSWHHHHHHMSCFWCVFNPIIIFERATFVLNLFDTVKWLKYVKVVNVCVVFCLTSRTDSVGGSFLYVSSGLSACVMSVWQRLWFLHVEMICLMVWL